MIVIFLLAAILCAPSNLQAVTPDAEAYLLHAKQRYDQIHSYRCRASNVVMKYGLLKPTRYANTVLYSFEKPDKIRMTWIEPFLLKGQTAVFQNKELQVKMRFVPFAVKMDPNGFLTQDPAGNRIYDTHIGRLIDKLLGTIDSETRVFVEADAHRKRESGTTPVIIENSQGRVVTQVDDALGLPTSIEFFGPDGKLQQACYFEDITLNVRFDSKEFDLSASKTS